MINVTVVVISGYISFIDIVDIYCFGTGLLMSMSEDVYQYRHFNLKCKLALEISEINPKSEEIVHFISRFCSFECVFNQNCHCFVVINFAFSQQLGELE